MRDPGHSSEEESAELAPSQEGPSPLGMICPRIGSFLWALTPAVSSPSGVIPALGKVCDDLSGKHLSSGCREMNLAGFERWALYLFPTYFYIISLESVLFPRICQADLQL